MAYRLIAKRGNDIYEHIPLPSIVIGHSFKYEEGTSNLIEDVETWTITGFLIAPQGSIKSQTLEFTEFFEGGELDYVRFQDEDEIVDQLADDNGVRITGLEFPEGDGPEWATKRKYVITLEGINTSLSVETGGECDYTITYSTDQSGIITRTISGTLKDKSGSALAKYITLKSDNSWDTWTDANLISDEYTTNDDDTEVSFTIVHKKYWVAFPAGITNSNVDYNTITDDQNVTRGRISGWFEGSESDCAAAITNCYPIASIVLNYSLTRSVHTNRTSFSISYISLLSNDVLEFNESLTIDAQVYDFIYHRVLGGAPPVRQVTSKTTARATQTGSCTRIGLMPEVKAPHWNPMYVKSSRITQESAKWNTAFGSFAYTINWTYNFEFDITPAF